MPRSGVVVVVPRAVLPERVRCDASTSHENGETAMILLVVSPWIRQPRPVGVPRAALAVRHPPVFSLAASLQEAGHRSATYLARGWSRSRPEARPLVDIWDPAGSP